MPDCATAADVREVATGIRDLAAATAQIGTEVQRVENSSADHTRLLASIDESLKPVRTYFEALNKEHAATVANAAEAGNRKKATIDEWLAWLTPKRAVMIIAAIGTTCGLGGPATGLAGRVQVAADAAWTALMGEASTVDVSEENPS